MKFYGQKFIEENYRDKNFNKKLAGGLNITGGILDAALLKPPELTRLIIAAGKK